MKKLLDRGVTGGTGMELNCVREFESDGILAIWFNPSAHCPVDDSHEADVWCGAEVVSGTEVEVDVWLCNEHEKAPF